MVRGETRGVRCIAASMYFVVVSLCAGQDLIIETSPMGKNFDQYRELTGKWMDSKIPPSMAKSSAPDLTAPGTCGARKSVFSGPNVTTTSPVSARFFPRFKTPGRHHVYVTWPRAANADTVHYTIRHATGIEHRKLAQNGWGAPPLPCNAGVWIPLGEYNFNPGEDQFVEVSTDANVKELETRWYGQVYTDAMRFTEKPLTDLGTPLEPEAPPAAQGKELPLTVQAKPMEWETDLREAFAKAKERKRNLLVFAFLPNSEGTKSIDEKLLALPEIRAALDARFVLVRVDIGANRDLAKKLGIFRANIINLYNTAGEAQTQLSDDNTAQEFLDAMRKM